MSIGIAGMIFGKGREFFIGKKAYTHSLVLAEINTLKLESKLEDALKVDFNLISVEIAIRW